MRTVDIQEAKTHLSRLVYAAAKGEPFVMAQAGRPLVKGVALVEPPKNPVRRMEFMRGQISIPDNFDTMGQDEIIRIFAGDPE